MTKMIDILIDDRKFVFSRHVLEQNPEFIVTQILRGMALVNDYPFIERVDDHTFRIDISIHDFEKIAMDLRSKDDKQKDVRMRLMIPMDDQISQFTGLSTDTQNHVDMNDLNLESGLNSTRLCDFVNIPDLTEHDDRYSVSIISEKSAKHSQSVFDPLNMLDTKPSRSKSDMGIFRRSDAHRADTHRADTHKGGGKESKHTKMDAYIGFTEMSQDNNVFNMNMSDVISPLQHIVPKGHHVYKSRKIELDTSEHKR